MVTSGQKSFAQKIDSIYFNLYTDSLKKGSFNYINVEGRSESGKIIPLDSSQLIFKSSFGKFHGNSLWLPWETNQEYVDVTVNFRLNNSMILNRRIWIKKKQD